MLGIDLLEPYSFEFFRHGIIVATIAGALCGLLGVFVILRGMSYIGHGLSHAVFGGAAASAVIGVNFFIGAGIWGVVSGVLIARVARRRVLGADAAIGVVTTASFALGLALMNRYGQASKSIEAVLFGSVLGVRFTDIVAVAAVALLSLAIIVVWYRRLLFSTFDRDVAQVSGVNVGLVEAVLLALLSLTILVTMRADGTQAIPDHIGEVEALVGAYLSTQRQQHVHVWTDDLARIRESTRCGSRETGDHRAKRCSGEFAVRSLQGVRRPTGDRVFEFQHRARRSVGVAVGEGRVKVSGQTLGRLTQVRVSHLLNDWRRRGSGSRCRCRRLGIAQAVEGKRLPGGNLRRTVSQTERHDPLADHARRIGIDVDHDAGVFIDSKHVRRIVELAFEHRQ
ncbi:MAG: metal ABC transporter permease, partial [Actinobacteria bacterium]|nr:metal ABC transporter permease [Actinomycetota bacterium]